MKKKLGEHPVLGLILSSVLLELALETLFRHSVGKAFWFVWQKPALFLLNVLILLAFYTLATPMRKRFAMRMTITLLWLTFGVTNFVISLYRNLPFTVVDLLLVKDLFSLIDVYFNPIQIALIFAALAGVIVAITFLFIKTKKRERLPLSLSLPAAVTPALLAFLCCLMGVHLGGLENDFYSLTDAYKENGFAYCFVRTFADVGMAKPETYSDEAIAELDQQIFETTPTAVPEPERMPNVIYLQLESFFDVSRMIGYESSENPIPNFTALRENYPSGLLYVPTSGGGTVNTEMEILTGMNINFFGAGEYPYYTILRDTCCESVAYNLAALGYEATAIHNNSGSFYSRNEVYSRLGFSRFDSVEYMPNVCYTPRGWAKDDVLEQEIFEALRTTDAPDFLFAVSVQPHGSYPNEENYEHNMLLDTEEGVNPYSLEYYVEQIREVDEFIGSLTSALSDFDEDVVLVLYGDHLPALGLSNEMLDTGDLFTSEYVIWSNFDLAGEDQDLEAYQLTSRVMGMIGIDAGTMTYFHQNCAGTESYLDDQKLLQYDMLYGDRSIYGGTLPFEQTTLQMGLRPITLDEAKMQYGYLCVFGSGFTPYSKVVENDELLETLYISPTQLVVANYERTEESSVCVAQVSEDQIQLSRTDMMPVGEDTTGGKNK